MTTAAPSSARRRAIAKPIPFVEAVITATFPSNLLRRTALPISLLTPTTSRKSEQENTDFLYNKKRISAVSSSPSFTAVFECTTTPSRKLRNRENSAMGACAPETLNPNSSKPQLFWMTFALSWGVVLVPPIVALLDEICAFLGVFPTVAHFG